MPHIETDVELLGLEGSDVQKSDFSGLIVRQRFNNEPSSAWVHVLMQALKESKNALLNNGLRVTDGRIEYITGTGTLPGGKDISERKRDAVVALVATANEMAKKHNDEEDETIRQANEQAQASQAEFERAKKILIGK